MWLRTVMTIEKNNLNFAPNRNQWRLEYKQRTMRNERRLNRVHNTGHV